VRGPGAGVRRCRYGRAEEKHQEHQEAEGSGMMGDGACWRRGAVRLNLGRRMGYGQPPFRCVYSSKAVSRAAHRGKISRPSSRLEMTLGLSGDHTPYQDLDLTNGN
jgi:hypothetical protein